MLTIESKQGFGGFCDGLSRREFLKIGGLAMGGLSLPQLLAAEAKAGIRNNHKAIIMVFLPGGPPHQDMFDLKPDAPSEIRGEFKPIKTNVPGIEICEHMPRLAKMMDKFAIVRSLVGARDEHSSTICNSGYSVFETVQNKWPAMGSVLSKLQGPTSPTVPPFVGLAAKCDHMPWGDPGDPGFLGLEHAPFRPSGDLMKDMTLKGISLERLQDRRRLLQSVDRFRRSVDSMKSMDALSERAFSILTSSKMVEALDLKKEDPKVVEAYGKGREKAVDDGAPMINEEFLMARRLVEAGVRCVTLAYGRWDYHGNNFGQLRDYLPKLDACLSALVTDIHNRGLDKDVSVVVWGEFGRTPRVNGEAGRDHWPRVSQCLVAGGGMRTGQVIGSTTKDAGEAEDRPIHYKEVMTTLYSRMGIRISETNVPDESGKSHYLFAEQEPIAELV